MQRVPGKLLAAASLVACLAPVAAALPQELIWRVVGSTPGDVLGSGVARVGDFNADGVDDLAIASMSDDSGAIDGGSVRVVDARTGATLLTITGKTSEQLGSVYRIGDVDGDGATDFAALVPNAKAAATDAYGAAVLCSGRTRGELARFEARAHERVVGVSATGDIDGDGTRDLALGVFDRSMSIGVVWIVGSRSGTRLRALTNQDDFLRGIDDVPFVDLDGDGDDELVWANLNHSVPRTTLPLGSVQVERSGPLFLTSLPKHPRSSGNLKERLSAPPPLGGDGASDRRFAFHLAGFAPGSLAHLVVVGIDGVPMQLPAGSGVVHADGTLRIDWVVPSHLRPDRIEFVATGIDALGTPGTSGVDFIVWP